MAGVERVGADWLFISDSQHSLGTVQVNIWVPSARSGADPSGLPKESTSFEVRTLAVLRQAVVQWGYDGNPLPVLTSSSPRALWGVDNAAAIAEKLTSQDRDRCSGRIAFRRSLGMVAAALWDRLHGPLEPINDPPQTYGLLTCSLKFTPPMGKLNSKAIVEQLWTGRNG